MVIFFYSLFIRIYVLGIRAAAPFHPKARAWVEGRRNWRRRLEEALSQKVNRSRQRLVWIHCASLGEFEQGRPLIESLKAQQANTAILLSFFSPSGYEIRKDYPLADYVTYLPADTRRQARDFINIVQPDLVVFVKYEFWFHHLSAVQNRNIPLLLISALFRPSQVFFQPWGGPFRRLLRKFTQLFVQDEPSAQQVRKLGIPQVWQVGDTRVDRVAAIAAQAREIPLAAAFAAGHLVLVAGSTWAPDEDLLAELLNGELPDNWKVIIAPHRIEPDHLQRLEQQLRLPYIRFSAATTDQAAAARILIIDNIGMLSALYRYGKLAYIGGGFGAGIHNTLEPVAFGLPVIFGPRYEKFREAVQLVNTGGAFPVRKAGELIAVFKSLQDSGRYTEAARQAYTYVQENQGATQRILDHIVSRLHTPFRQSGGSGTPRE